MICTLNNYYFRVEERVSDDSSGNSSSGNSSASSDVTEGISERSIADFICYSVREGKKLVTVILETKQNFTTNGLAQLLGYFYRAGTSYHDIGLCLLLAKKSLHCILCPFGDESGTLTKSICLKPIQLQDLHGVLYLVAVITSSSFRRQSLTVLQRKFLPIQKQFKFFIEYEEEKRTRELENKIKQLEQHVEKLEKECRRNKTGLAQLQCKYLPIQVNLTRQQ